MKRICAWCQKSLGAKTGEDENNSFPITHGICGDCRTRFIEKSQRISIREYLDSIPVPVAVVDSNGRYLQANAAALAFFGISEDQIIGRLQGDFFECENASLPEGCTRTERCGSCKLRESIMQTSATGRPHINISTRIYHSTGSEEHFTSLTISTEKAKNTVLIRIQEMKKECALAKPEHEQT